MIPFINPQVAGFIPDFFSEDDPRSARDQLHENYAHGGGVYPFPGFTLHHWDRPGAAYLTYPGDPPMREVSRATLREETLIVFDYAWLAIVQPSGDHIITRVD